jgi:capsular exopolysaccharide synthesis family protein
VADVSRRIGVEAFPIPPLPTAGRPRALGRPRPRDGIDTEYLLKASDYVHRMDHVREALCGGLAPGAPGRCVLITSAVGGEGKTSLASQLAARCANAGATTLLIDCDLRRPSLNRVLDVPEGIGLADVLRGDAALEDALVSLGLLSCTLLPAGRPEANPARLLLGQTIGPLLARLRRSYEVVIIDSPPVLPVPDALALGRFVDGAVLASRYDSSRLRLVDQAHRTLMSVGIPILGVVVNGVRSDAHFGGAYTASYAASYPVADPVESRPGG